ncbi:VOC family protein [Candidatus Woesearchaeota archaeon]|nr:VOC family protein [Candidatus Woesearchaeota archaeon]
MDPVVHFEMPAEDKKRAKKFYEKVFGWKMQQLGHDMGDYLLATTSPMDENSMHINKGAINGGFYQKGENGIIPHIVIAVKDLKKSTDAVKKSGGKIEGEPMSIPGIGDFVMFKDTEGNRVGMLQPTNM